VLEPGRGPEEDKDKEDKVREMRRKNKRGREKGRQIETKNKINKVNKKEKGIVDISSSHPPYTARGSCFAKRFLKMSTAPSKKPLLKSQSRSRFRRSRSPANHA
jgi:hypothetical protein